MKTLTLNNLKQYNENIAQGSNHNQKRNAIE